mgnify:CR=1 FL=1
MRILVVNDDGIKAPGIKSLVQMAAGFGKVWVAAPAAQCSAMFQRDHRAWRSDCEKAAEK